MTVVEFARGEYPLLDELKALLWIPSVSTLPEHKDDALRGGGAGGRVETHWDGECPVDRGSWPSARLCRLVDAAGKPTCLCYDITMQPPDPLDEWLSLLFEPTERNGNV